ncbi:MAG TPA: DUF4190 domain-containing protein [Ktedonobacteraceae bacterium]|nr:DUF4190 domain-containing protein [Ktedonobacteraceae bacterium]
MMYSQPDPYSSQQPSGADPYSQQSSYPPPYTQHGAYPPPYQYPPQQPAATPYYPQQSPYPPQYLPLQRNVRARSAMINGIISLILSLLTLFTLVGFAGLITGTFAIVYGFIGLKTAKQLPNRLGYGQAVAGIILGFAGWFLVILSLAIRGALGS